MRVHWLGFLLAFPLVFAGCGDDDDNGGGSGGKPSGGAPSTGGKSSGGTPSTGGKSSGGTPSTGGSMSSMGGSPGSKGGVTGAGGSVIVGGGAGEAGEGVVAGGAGGAGGTGEAGRGGAGGEAGGAVTGLDAIDTVVVIYAENRSFDNLFGNFPGAHGLSEVVDSTGAVKPAYIAQKDRDGTSVLTTLPQTWNNVTAAGNPTVVTQAQSANLANAPFSIETAFVANGAPALTTADVTRDLAHRFFENIMEINGGTNDMFAAWSDAGGLTMGHFDFSHSALYALAQQYVLADNFFEGAYGGSFLNHQYLICACAPSVPASFITSNSPTMNVLGTPNAKDVPQLATNTTSPTSALDGAPSFKSGNIAPLDYFGANDGYRAVNTMQAPYQPSGNFPAAAATDLRYADPAGASTLPAQTQMTIGDLLTSKGVSWAWYATSWTNALADGMQAAGSTHTVIYTPNTPRGNPDFQPHHQPYNYYAAFDPATHAAERTAHMKDYTSLVSEIEAGTLPQVVYYKPTGYVNQHPGYANADDGDAHIADLVSKLKAGSQWQHMMIVITYDEYGGQWDHVAPPKGDKLGPGTRIPAIIISPYAKAGTVDHTQYDTASIIRLISRRFKLATLPGITARDSALVTNGGTAMGDLTNALNLP